MSEPQLILDYASPRKRGGVRLPATSKLAVTQDPRGEVRVVETLRGKDQALFGIVFGIAVTLIVTVVTSREVLHATRHDPKLIDFLLPAILAVLVATMLMLIVLIIRQTWRRTTLTADAERITLEFVAPLMRTWRREWPNADVGEVVVFTTQAEADAVRLAELQLRPPGVIIHLFTDHRELQLRELAEQMRRAMAGEPPVTPQPVTPFHEPDPQTLERLRGRRQELHDRLH
ncbi:MAG: hypothetical protein WBD40_02415 [Tepidisphaeraceae bacterium]